METLEVRAHCSHRSAASLSFLFCFVLSTEIFSSVLSSKTSEGIGGMASFEFDPTTNLLKYVIHVDSLVNAGEANIPGLLMSCVYFICVSGLFALHAYLFLFIPSLQSSSFLLLSCVHSVHSSHLLCPVCLDFFSWRSGLNVILVFLCQR